MQWDCSRKLFRDIICIFRKSISPDFLLCFIRVCTFHGSRIFDENYLGKYQSELCKGSQDFLMYLK